MQIKLKPLELSDTDDLYDFFQKLPASENGKNNRAHGLSCEEFADWVQKEIDSSMGRNSKPEYVSATTYVFYVDDTPVGVSNLRHRLSPSLEKDGGHIGIHVLPEYRGCGYGTAIERETLKKAKGMGINPVFIFNRDGNVPAWRISEKLGGKLASVNEIDGIKIRKYIFDMLKIGEI